MAEQLPDWLVIQQLKRWPATLPAETLQILERLGLPRENRDGGDPLASIVIVTFNGLPFTKLCLHSLLANTEGPAFEVILVDNGSQDGTPGWLEQACACNPKLRMLANSRNRGFAAAANQGLAQAKGDYLVLLNSDTILTPGWLSGLIKHLQQPGAGMIGPVTNRCGNEAEVEASYQTYGELLRFARQRSHSQSGRNLELGMLSLFCAAWPRRVLDEAGLLDERFEVGTFEDDDFSLRVRQAGYRLACADDCFIHHFGQVSFSQLGGSDDYQQRLKDNRQRFEAKWGRHWTPHRRRQDTLYLQLCDEVRALANEVLPADARVLVVSKGDDDLLRSLRASCSHFPQDGSGGYAGFYPADSQEAVAHLEELIAAGSQYLLIPQTSLWWLDYYSGLHSFLEERAKRVEASSEAAQIFQLS